MHYNEGTAQLIIVGTGLLDGWSPGLGMGLPIFEAKKKLEIKLA